MIPTACIPEAAVLAPHALDFAAPHRGMIGAPPAPTNLGPSIPPPHRFEVALSSGEGIATFFSDNRDRAYRAAERFADIERWPRGEISEGCDPDEVTRVYQDFWGERECVGSIWEVVS